MWKDPVSETVKVKGNIVNGLADIIKESFLQYRDGKEDRAAGSISCYQVSKRASADAELRGR